MLRGKFDTDLSALGKRIASNSNEFVLEDWVFQKCSNKPSKILDLGSGTGKQLKFLRGLFPEASITGVDKADTFKKTDIPGVTLVGVDFDDYEPHAIFDLVVSVYAIYYAKDPIRLLEKIINWTSPSGEIVLVGPDKDNNAELFQEIFDLSGLRVEMYPFMDEIQVAKLAEGAGRKMSVFRTENKIQFASPAEVLGWWKNHNTFQEDVFSKYASVMRTDCLTKKILMFKL